MKDNKPLLFINSAQSKEFKDQNQYVYDSRFDNKNLKIFQEIKKEPEKAKETKKVEFDVIKEEVPKEEKAIEDIDSGEDEIKKRKLRNKMELLNKRARLGRYVFVSVEIEGKVYEGYFMRLLSNSIILNVGEEEMEIPINDIRDIIILKV